MRGTGRGGLDPNSSINMAIVLGAVGVCVLLSIGAIVLIGMGKAPPDWVGSGITGIMGGLIGYLARDVTQTVSQAIKAKEDRDDADEAAKPQGEN